MAIFNNVRLANIVYGRKENQTLIQDIIIPLGPEHVLGNLGNGGGKTTLLHYISSSIIWYKGNNPIPYKHPIGRTEFIGIEFLLPNNEYLMILSIFQAREENSLDRLCACIKYTDTNYKNSLKNIKLTKEEDGITRFKTLEEMKIELSALPEASLYTKNSSSKYKEDMKMYNINIPEIENLSKIIKCEGGFNEYFVKQKDSSSFIREYIVPELIDKLNNEEDTDTTISITDTFNESIKNISIEKRNLLNTTSTIEILNFQEEEFEPIKKIATEHNEFYIKNKENETNLISTYKEGTALIQNNENTISNNNDIIAENEIKITKLNYQKDSLKAKKIERKIHQKQQEFQVKIKPFEENGNKIINLTLKACKQDAKKTFDEIEKINLDLENLQNEKKPYLEKNADKENKINDLKNKQNKYYSSKLIEKTYNIENKKSEQKDLSEQLENNKQFLKEINQKTENLLSDKIKTETIINNFKKDIDKKFDGKEIIQFNELSIEDSVKTQYEQLITKETNNLKNKETELDNLKNIKIQNDEKIDKNKDIIRDAEIEKNNIEISIKNVTKNILDYNNKKEEVINNIILFSYSEDDLKDKNYLLSNIKSKRTNNETTIDELKFEIKNISEREERIKNHQIIHDKTIIQILEKNNISYESGFSFIKNLTAEDEYKENLIKNNPILPYLIFISSSDFEKLKNIKDKDLNYLLDVINLFIKKENFEKLILEKTNNVIELNEEICCLIGTNTEIFKDNYEEFILKNLENKKNKLNSRLENLLENKKSLEKTITLLEEFSIYNENYLETEENKLNNLKTEKEILINKIETTKEENKKLKKEIENINIQIPILENEISSFKIYLDHLNLIFSNIETFFYNAKKLETIKFELEDIKIQKNALSSDIDNNISILNTIKCDIITMEQELKTFKNEKANHFINDSSIDINTYKSLDITNIELELENLTGTSFLKKINKTEEELLKEKNQKEELLKDKLSAVEKKCKKRLNEEFVNTYKSNNNIENFITIDDIKHIIYDERKMAEQELEIDDLIKKTNSQRSELTRLQGEISTLKEQLNEEKENIIVNYGKEYDKNVLEKDYDKEIENLENINSELQSENNELINTNKSINVTLDGIEEFNQELPKDYISAICITNENFSKEIKRYRLEYQKTLQLLNNSKNTLNNNLSLYKTKLEKKINITKFNGNSEINFIKNFDSLKAEIDKNPENALNAINQFLERNNSKKEVIERDLNVYNNSFENFVNNTSKLLNITHNNFKKLQSSSKLKTPIKGFNEVVKFKNIPQTINMENVKRYLESEIERYQKCDNTEEFRFIKFENVLDRALSINSIEIQVLVFNKDNAQFISYEDALSNKASGGQTSIISVCLMGTIFNFIGKINNIKDEKRTIICDNSFGVISSDYLLDVLFKIADNFGMYFFTLTAIEEPHIKKYHKRIINFFTNPKVKHNLLGLKETENDTFNKEIISEINTREVYQYQEQKSA